MRYKVFAAVLWCAAWASAGTTADLRRMEWTIGGVTREALIYAPPAARSAPCPVVFAFHGHGGTMGNAAAKFACHRYWPEAIAVYMQGLHTPGALTDPEGKRSGWQKTFGDQDDRDLKFFDAVLATLKTDYRVDARRIYATGHSNGGGFSYLLWAARGNVLAAIAPCAAAAKWEFRPMFKPKPVFHMAGENDPLVRFAWQRLTIDEVRKINGCGAGKPWGEHCTLYPSPAGNPVVTYIHSGGHELPSDVPPVIVKFFKEHPKP
jgi:polyhydroxybutyrate depolymerase